jgi:hypothetical protein
MKAQKEEKREEKEVFQLCATSTGEFMKFSHSNQKREEKKL